MSELNPFSMYVLSDFGTLEALALHCSATEVDYLAEELLNSFANGFDLEKAILEYYSLTSISAGQLQAIAKHGHLLRVLKSFLVIKQDNLLLLERVELAISLTFVCADVSSHDSGSDALLLRGGMEGVVDEIRALYERNSLFEGETARRESRTQRFLRSLPE
jgi:hypothetical protein